MHVMKFSRFFPLVLAISGSLSAAEVPRVFRGAEPIEWSKRLASSEMSRRGKSLCKDGAPKARWEYTSGLLAHSLMELGRATGEGNFTGYASDLTASFVSADGSIATYRDDEFNIDMILPGRALIAYYRQNPDERFKIAAATLRGQLEKHPRTSDGGFWHKKKYPYQMWLDGIYMGSPFLAEYGEVFHDSSAFDEVVKQIVLMDRHSYDPKVGLHYHGWDEKRAQSWANPQTGCSPCFWGRSVGWYAMAIVDCLEHLPADHPGVGDVKEVLLRLAAGVKRWQDPASGLWWQVLDQGGRQGNYQEASASAMFVYAIAKAVNRGWLPRETYLPCVIKGYEGMVRDFIREEGGKTSLTRVCEVAGLGFTTANGKPRDGSFGYYISEPVIDNDLKGVGPFILAGIEVGRLVGASANGWQDLDAVLSRIKPPVFPDKDFSITDFGAKQGSDATKAIHDAIAACHAAGGGRVVIPDGKWSTGAIELKSKVNLHIPEGATLMFSTNPALYPIVATRWEGIECMNYSALIHADGQRDIAVTGGGILDGQADPTTWWAWNDKKHKPSLQQAARDKLLSMGESGAPVKDRVFGEGSFLRPNFIQFQHCENILIEGITIHRSPMWEIHPVLSNNITVRKVRVSTHGPNNDGCDPESCRDVLIEDCVFDTGDDCIAIKSGRNNDGRRVNVPSENLVVRRCRMIDGHGGVVLGSEISGGVRNVFIEDCEMDSENLDRALRFKSNAMRGGFMENVFMRNVRIGRVAEAVLTIDFQYEEGAKGPHRPVVRNVVLENITSQNSPRVLNVRGFEGAVIDGVRISNSTFNGLTSPDVLEQAGDIRFEKTTRNFKTNP